MDIKRKRLYWAWQEMIKRCTNKKSGCYKYYGGRGIKVCDHWLKFENFFSDMGDRPAGLSLDRINNDGNYEPGNCRWADDFTQALNRRSTKLITFNGVTKGRRQWERHLRFGDGTLARRLASGWSLKDALTTPLATQQSIAGKIRQRRDML